MLDSVIKDICFGVPSKAAALARTSSKSGEGCKKTTGDLLLFTDADVIYKEPYIDKIVEFVSEVDHLYIEAAFLDEHRDIAREKYHLTARQAGTIAARARVKQFTLFHFSPRYTDEGHRLEAEAKKAYDAVISSR